MSNDLSIKTARKARAAEVIELMIRGSNKKDALEKVGIDNRTYQDIINEHPELLQNIETLYLDRLSGVVEEIIEERASNINAIMKFSKTLRDRMELNLFDESAAKLLVRLDAHIQDRFLKPIFDRKPKEEPTSMVPVDSKDQKAAAAILANLGARTVKVRRITEEVEVSPDQAPLEGEVYDVVPGGEIKGNN